MKDEIIIKFPNRDNLILYKIESKNYENYTIWKTKEFPLIKITQKDSLDYQTKESVEKISNRIPENLLELIVEQFNEEIDLLLNRNVCAHLRVLGENEKPFKQGWIYYDTFTLTDKGYNKIASKRTLLSNANGYVKLCHNLSEKINDRFIRVTELEIRLEADKKSKEYKETVEYEDANGIFKATSNPIEKELPYVDIKISHLNLDIEGIRIKGELFSAKIL